MLIEKNLAPLSGYLMAVLQTAVFTSGVLLMNWDYLEAPGILVLLIALLMFRGYFTVLPGEAKVISVLGNYKGSVSKGGFYWVHPLAKRLPVSLKTHVFECEKLRVYDKRGIPIDISASVIWKVEDTVKALFEVENPQQMVEVNTNMTLRMLAETYPFDNPGEDSDTVTLRGNTKALAGVLQSQMKDKLVETGILIKDARIKHLSYAPEIAEEMLRVYQQEATLAARKKQALHAVDMAEMILQKAESRSMIKLQEPERSKAVAELLVSFSKNLNG
ncbi:SPFH domain-containing protein [Limibacter armeniacum]|uniref:SPFH domain-containing protein n=1 Tax=Limibacter armeniacum TaxID=466084 RepID=UPI002FE6284B